MNKRVLFGLGVAVALVIAIGAYFLIAAKNAERASIGATQTKAAAGTDDSTPLKEAPQIAADEMFLGDANAKLAIVEYFSLGCPHCASFHKEILPQLKSEYIDTGKVRLVFRDFPFDQPALAAAMLTRCVPSMAYFAMVDTLFQQQDAWHIQNGQAVLTGIAKGAGLDQARVDACFNDTALRERMVIGIQEAKAKYEIQSTPSFLIGERKVSGTGAYADFRATIEAQLAKLP